MNQQTDRLNADLVIAGGGFAGLALALALRQALGADFSVVVCDPAFARGPSKDERASAFAAGPCRMLDQLGVWERISGEAQPILDMVITDSKVADPVRPVFLSFAEEVAPGEPFAHMIENRLVLDALHARAQEMGLTLLATGVSNVERTAAGASVQLADGRRLACRLVVAADGARSKLRDMAGIRTHGWSYGQSGIVATIAHERDHHGRAEEHFLPAGPFAKLPLTHHRTSIVWTEPNEVADRMVVLPDEQFLEEVERRFGLEQGEIRLDGPRRAFPLGFFIAREFVAERLALIGDAAHLIHPIAGQGLNMGLRDVAALAECIADAARLGLDVGGAEVLERYQRWRRFDTVSMGLATDGLNRLFSNGSEALRLVRDFGLGLVERMPRLKRMFIAEAAGITGEVPKLMRGELL